MSRPVGHRRRLLILAVLLATAGSVPAVRAQTEAADFCRIGFGGALTTRVSDYQCVGINPANLGFVPETDLYVMSSPLGGGIERRRRSWSVGVGEVGFTTHSDVLSRSDLWDAVFQSSSFTFTQEQKFEAAKAFANGGIRFSADILSAGIAYQDDWGGIAVSVRERIAGTFRFNESASRLAFEGRYFDYFDSLATNFNGDTVGYATQPKRYSEIFDGTRLALTWYRELGVSYGVRVVDVPDFRLHVGAGVKYLLGYAFLDAEVRQGTLQAQSALSPFFGINYGKAQSPSTIPGTGFNAVGSGWSADVGVTAELFSQWSVSVAAVDLGAMRWNGNVYQAKDTILNGLSSQGFNNYNIFEEAPKITGEGNFFKWDGLASTTAELASRFRAGISYRHSTEWTFGADVVTPFNRAAGALGEPIVSVGVDWRPLVWLRLSTGIGGGGNMGTFVPVGVMTSLFDGFWEAGIQSRDIATLVVSRRPVLSLCVAALRFRF